MQRDFTREKTKLERNNKKINRQIQTMLKKGESRANIKIVAAGIAKNNTFIKKYARLDAQLDNC